MSLLLQLWATHFRPEYVRPALEKSLKKLQMDYVDLIIMHLPVPMKVSIWFSLLCVACFHQCYY